MGAKSKKKSMDKSDSSRVTVKSEPISSDSEQDRKNSNKESFDMMKEIKKEIKTEKESLTKESRLYNEDKSVKSEKESRYPACDEKTFRKQKDMKQLLIQ